MNTTTFREITEEAERRGRVEGLLEGRVEHARETLLRQLRVKFPAALSAEVEQRVATAELAQLDQWLERVIAADALDQVFA